MPLTEDERSAYELLVSLTPGDLEQPLDAIPKVLTFLDTKLAPLIAKLDEMASKRDAEARQRLIQHLHDDDRITIEEATRFVDEKHPYEMENGPCRACDGRGHIWESACMGVKHRNCSKCHGRNSGSRMRLRLPWAAHGPVIPF